MSVLSADANADTGRSRLAAVRGAAVPSRPLIMLVAAQLVTGALIGLIWLSWAPKAVSYLLSDGNGGSLVIPDESEAQVAGDGRFVVLTLIAGLLFGLLAWRLRSARGPLTVAVLGVGSVLGSLLAMLTGRLLSGGTNSAAINTAFHPPLTLHATAALWLQALLAVLVYTALAGMSSDPGLGASPKAPSEAQPLELPPLATEGG
ncbi:MAG: DUF2567 domain-containing protein [Actinomycetota bacterium]|nr:DUF2567 domain-containing protein [Actinomycetota bacterium]